MRELNECTAEVFRRSEKRIRERRRNRKRILSLCIPVCLIITVWAVIIFPGMIPALDTSDLAQYAEAETVENAEGSPACPYTAVEIQDAGIYPEENDRRVTDRLAVAEMFRAVQSLFADADGSDRDVSGNCTSNENIPAAEDNLNHDLTDSESKWKVCTITFTAEDGSQTVYHLSGNTLVNGNTNETVFLSEDQAAGLLTVLGLSE